MKKNQIILCLLFVLASASCFGSEDRAFDIKSIKDCKPKIKLRRITDNFSYEDNELFFNGVVKFLSRENVVVNRRDNQGRVFLSSVIRYCPQFALALIEKGASVSFCDSETKCRPLMVACRYGHEDIVIQLIDAGANINEVDSSGHSALYFAKEFNPDLVPLLLQAGAIDSEVSESEELTGG